MNAPCKDCQERKLFCHGRCERYRSFRDELDRRAEEKAKKDASTPELAREIVKQIWREMKCGR